MFPKFLTRAVAFCALLFGFPLNGAAAQTARVTFAAAPGPLDNPLKGWCTYTDAGKIRQPYSLIYRYASWKELEPTPGKFSFDAWEKRDWNDDASRGRHVVFRVYLDYPGKPSGLPDWLRGVQTRPYDDYGGGASPDYENPELVAGLERLIAALGRRYDQNPRIAFVAVGLLGFWGEWHTYPHSEWMASDAVQARVLAAYRRAFPHKILLLRYGRRSPDFGFHDDLFPADTDGPEPWKFLPKLRTTGSADNWKRAAIGGEMEPGAAKKWLGTDWKTTQDAVSAGHFSWIGPYNPALEAEQTPEFVARSEELVRRMGYEFRLREMEYTPVIRQNGKLTLTLRGQNNSVAPFYYPWPVHFVLLDERGEIRQTLASKTDIRRWQPGSWTLTLSTPVKIQPGQYRLALGILDPMTNQSAVRFANALPNVNDWTILANLRVAYGAGKTIAASARSGSVRGRPGRKGRSQNQKKP